MSRSVWHTCCENGTHPNDRRLGDGGELALKSSMSAWLAQETDCDRPIAYCLLCRERPMFARSQARSVRQTCWPRCAEATAQPRVAAARTECLPTMAFGCIGTAPPPDVREQDGAGRRRIHDTTHRTKPGHLPNPTTAPTTPIAGSVQ